MFMFGFIYQTVAPAPSAQNSVEDDGGWADFSSASPAPPNNDFTTQFAQPDVTSNIPQLGDITQNNTLVNDAMSVGSSEGKPKPNFSSLEGAFKSVTPEMSRVSSTLSFDHKNNAADVTNDNDSDWSGFAVQAAIHADNISSDWSFKDNASHGFTADDGRSVTSDGASKAVDWTIGSQSLTVDNSVKGMDWSVGGQSTSSLQAVNQEEDEWAAFGAIDRTKKPPPASEVAREATNDTGWGDFDDSAPAHSPPPFSPGSQGSGEFSFRDSNQKTEEGGWGAFTDLPTTSKNVPSLNTVNIDLPNDKVKDNVSELPQSIAHESIVGESANERQTEDFGAFGGINDDSTQPAHNEQNDFSAFDEGPIQQDLHLKSEPDNFGDFDAFAKTSSSIKWDNFPATQSDADTVTVRPSTLGGDTLTQSSVDTDTHHFSPPPMSDSGDHLDDEWAEFGSHAPPLSASPSHNHDEEKWGAFSDEPPVSDQPATRDDTSDDRLRSESPGHEFSGPPLTDRDFSPLKSAGTRPVSDWFNFPATEENPPVK